MNGLDIFACVFLVAGFITLFVVCLTIGRRKL